MGSIFDWSKIEWDNQISDNTINWKEGQLPSTVNDSARAMMARIAEFVEDICGYTVTTGSESLYLLSTATEIKLYHNRIRLNLLVHTTCDNFASLSVNNLGALPILKKGNKSLVPIEKGDLIAGDIYTVHYLYDSQKKRACWRVYGVTKNSNPTGMISAFANQFSDPNWLYCNGSEVPIESYRDLYAVIGHMWGSSKKDGYFKLPDLRGSFLRGWDDKRNLDSESSRAFASFQKSNFQAHKHSAKTIPSGEHTHEVNLSCYDPTVPTKNNDYRLVNKIMWRNADIQVSAEKSGNHIHAIEMDEEGGKETCPSNYAIAYYIKV